MALFGTPYHIYGTCASREQVQNPLHPLRHKFFFLAIMFQPSSKNKTRKKNLQIERIQ
jgi:hypothetical protein